MVKVFETRKVVPCNAAGGVNWMYGKMLFGIAPVPVSGSYRDLKGWLAAVLNEGSAKDKNQGSKGKDQKGGCYAEQPNVPISGRKNVQFLNLLFICGRQQQPLDGCVHFYKAAYFIQGHYRRQ